MPEVQMSPAAGRDSRQWEPHTLSLTRGERANMEREAREALVQNGGFPSTPEQQVALAEHLAERIEEYSPRLPEALARLRFEKGSEAQVVFGIPATNEEVTRIVHLATSTMIGSIFNYAEQNKGALSMRLEPQAGSAADTNTTPGEFNLHSDDAVMPEELRTGWISLIGIRNPRGTLTGYAPIDIALRDVPLHLRNTLFSPRFKVRTPLSFGLGNDRWSGPSAILGQDDYSRVTVAWPSYATEPFDPQDVEAIEALAALKLAAERAINYVALSPGTMLVFSNFHGVHKRTAITGDGSRLVLRNYIRPDLDALRARSGHGGYVFSLSSLMS